MIEAGNNKDEITLTVTERSGKERKYYFKAKDEAERDKVLRQLLESLARAPFGEMKPGSNGPTTT